MLGSYKDNRKQIFLVDYLYVMDKDEVQLDERLDIHHYINSSNDYLKMGEKLGLLYLESILEENKYSVTIYKVVNKKDEDCFIRLLKENNAKMVGFSLTYDNLTNINRFCDRLKRIYPDIPEKLLFFEYCQSYKWKNFKWMQRHCISFRS